MGDVHTNHDLLIEKHESMVMPEYAERSIQKQMLIPLKNDSNSYATVKSRPDGNGKKYFKVQDQLCIIYDGLHVMVSS